MSSASLPAHGHAPTEFSFSLENQATAKKLIAKYPAGREASAVIPLLDLAQRQAGGWLPRVAMDHVAKVLDMPPMRVYEVASFYTMFNLKPVGVHFVQICTTTPCWLRGSDQVVHACKKELGIDLGETTADGQFTLIEVECLGACVNAPMVQINDDFYEDLDEASTAKVLQALKAGQKPATGPQNGRIRAAPLGGLTSLTDLPAGKKEPS